jgi:hypothetical protein
LPHNLEYRLKAGSGQDRSVTRRIYARTTDKSCENRRIYSLVPSNNSNETRVPLRYKGEVGMAVNAVRFIQSSLCPRYAVAAHSINLTFIFGQQAFGFTSLDGMVKMIIARGPDKNDVFDQFVTLTYKVYGVALALNPSAGRILVTAERS